MQRNCPLFDLVWKRQLPNTMLTTQCYYITSAGIGLVTTSPRHNNHDGLLKLCRGDAISRSIPTHDIIIIWLVRRCCAMPEIMVFVKTGSL